MNNSAVPDIRIRRRNDRPVNPAGDYVLYRMQAFRRLTWNFALQRAVEWAVQLTRPLLIFEALPLTTGPASARCHGFVLDGIRDHLQACRRLPVGYYPYLETAPGEANRLLAALCEQACLLVADDSPADDAVQIPVEAAGKVHSDIQRGFIRAETMTYDDLKECGDEKAVKAAGKMRLEGKTYIVQDGDIISFRFNV